jgi:hypothetical protein
MIGPDAQGPVGSASDELRRDFAVRGHVHNADRTAAREREVGVIVALPAQGIEDEISFAGPFLFDPRSDNLPGVLPKRVDVAEEAGGAVALPGCTN